MQERRDPAGVRRPATAGFVGRHRERRLLRHLLDQAREGRPTVVVVHGVPGSGKTALLRWLAAEAADELVLRTAGDQGAPPFTAVRRLVAPLPELVDATRRRLADSDVEPPLLASPGAHAPVDLAPEIADGVLARARRRPLLLTVDDAHLLGVASTAVLEAVLVAVDDAESRGGSHLLAVLAADTTATDGLTQRASRLGAARTLPLGGLDEHDVADMLAAGLPAAGSAGPLPPTLIQEVMEATGGLPLLVEGEIERRARGGLPRDMRARSIADALQVRLDKVDISTRDLLRDAALLAEPWTCAELAAAADRSLTDVETHVEQAVDVELLERDADGVRFAHPVLRSELTSAWNRTDRARRHHAVADRLGRRELPPDAADDALLRRADHLLRGEECLVDADRATAAETVLHAGNVALRWGAWHDAARLLSASIRLAPEATSPDELIRRHLSAGTAAWFDHDVERSEHHFGAALDLAREHDRTRQLDASIRLTLVRLSERPLRLGVRPDVSELEDALAAAPTSGVRDDATEDEPLALQMEGRAVLAEALFASGESDLALDLVAEARQQATVPTPPAGSPAGSPSPDARRRAVRARSRLAFAEGLHHLGRLDLAAAASCFTEGLAAARVADDPLLVLTLRSRRALVALVEGRADEARVELAAVEDEALRRRLWGEADFAMVLLATRAVLAGDPDAVDVVDRARRLFRRSTHAYTAAVLAPALHALTARRRGTDAPAAVHALGTADTDDDGALRPSAAVGVLCAVEAGDAAAARTRLATTSWRRGPSGAVTLGNLPILAALVDAGDLLDDTGTVVSARAGLDAAAATGVAVILTWPTTVPRLQAVAARHVGDAAAARRHANRALRLAERERLAAERAKVLVELARLEAAGGDRGTAADLLDEAARGFDACSMPGWLRRCEAVADALGVPATRHPARLVEDRTILTTDIVGSTAANARLGDALYLELLRMHDRIVRSRLREHGGDEIKHTGDGVNAVFSDAADAARCALAIQADFADWQRAEANMALEVRCGLARGPLIPAGGDYHGIVQAEAARLCSLAGPGQVLVSEMVAKAAGDVTAHSHGRHHLRGFADEVEVFRLAHEP